MESSSKTARPYAMAAFQQAREEGKIGEWSEMLALLERVIIDPAMSEAISSPRLTRSQLADLIVEVCGDNLSPTGANFVRVLGENHRFGVIADIAESFEAERARAEQRSEVTVTSAYELSDAEQAVINDALTRRLGTKVDLHVEVDKSLIGGVVIQTGDTVIDASIRGQLNQMAQSIS